VARLLLVEAVRGSLEYVKNALHADGFVVDIESDPARAVSFAKAIEYSLIVLEVDSVSMARDRMIDPVRRSDTCHILIITAKDTVEERVEALSTGADDVLQKPFVYAELVARIQAGLRRNVAAGEICRSSLRLADLELNLTSRRVTRGGALIELTLREYQLLSVLLERKNAVLSREFLTQQVWDASFNGSSKVVDVAVSRLRSKIDDNHSAKLLQTVRGVGYTLRDDHRAGM